MAGIAVPVEPKVDKSGHEQDARTPEKYQSERHQSQFFPSVLRSRSLRSRSRWSTSYAGGVPIKRVWQTVTRGQHPSADTVPRNTPIGSLRRRSEPALAFKLELLMKRPVSRGSRWSWEAHTARVCLFAVCLRGITRGATASP